MYKNTVSSATPHIIPNFLLENVKTCTVYFHNASASGSAPFWEIPGYYL